MAAATVENNEYFPQPLIQAGLIEKSIWYSFTLPTVRNVKISLKQQDTGIQQQDIGFAVYKDPGGFAGPDKLADEFPVMIKMGNVANSCLSAGTYYIQVGARQRVVDSVWIEVSCKKEIVSICEPATPLPFIPGYFGNDRLYVHPDECHYIGDPALLLISGNPKYNQVFNFQFEAEASYTYYELRIAPDRNYNRAMATYCKVVVLETDYPRPVHQWKIVDSVSLDLNIYRPEHVFKWSCLTNNLLPPGKYHILLFSEKGTLEQAELEFTCVNGFSAMPHNNPKNLSSSRKLGVLNKKYVTYLDTLSCAAIIDPAICPAINQNLYKMSYSGDTDRYTHQGWYTFELKEETNLSIDVESWTTNVPYRLYSGDVVNSCQLNEVSPFSAESFCLSAGTYSLRLLYYNLPDFFENEVEVKFNKAEVFSPVFRYNDSLNPENLGDVLQKFPNPTLSTGGYFDNQEQSLLAGSDTIRGSMQYREFYISSKLPFNIYVSHSTGYGYSEHGYLFRGRKSQGGGTAYIKEAYGIHREFCGMEDTGWYTLVIVKAAITGYCYRKGVDHPYAPGVFPQKGCEQDQSGSMDQPIRLNGGLPLSPAGVFIDGTLHQAAGSFEEPDICFRCSNMDTAYTSWLFARCPAENHAGMVLNFVEFELAREAEIQILVQNYWGYRSFQMIRGSLRSNPQALYDAGAYIEPCERGAGFCGMQAGSYTLILFGEPGTVVQKLDLRVVPLTPQSNNFIENYKDIGLVKGTTKTPAFLHHCGLYADSGDLWLHHTYSYSHEVDTGKYTRLSYYTVNSLWYAFELEGLGELSILSPAAYTVYEIPDTVDLDLLKGDASNRKIMTSFMKPVMSAEAEQLPAVLYNGVCHKRRFLLGTRDGSYGKGNPGQIEFTWTPATKTPALPDKCSSTPLLNVQNFGTHTAKLDPRCLTIGEGFGEDGNNMACLPVYDGYVTAWAKVHIEPGDKYDIRFRVNASNGLIPGYYRVLYGSCSALTPGPCVEDLAASFGFECMEAGDYFFQILVPKDLRDSYDENNTVEIQVEVTPTKVPSCRPFDPFRPMASFAFEGNCEADSIHFKNYSSQGSDIAYHWTFSDGQSSALKDPVVLFTTQQAYEDIGVKLMVTNTKEQKSDSFERVVRVWKEAIKVDVPFTDSLVRCGAQIAITASTNVQDAVFLQSVNGADTVLGNSVSAHFTGYSTVRFIVFASGCFKDTLVKIRTHTNLDRLPEDSVVCTGQQLAFNLAPYSNVEWDPGSHLGATFHTSVPGKYYVTVSDSGCTWKDTIQVADRRQVFNHGSDTVSCSMDSLRLEIKPEYQNYRWFNGSDKKAVWVNSNGRYWVEGRWGSCLNRDSVRVRFVDLENAVVPDSVYFCEGTTVSVSSSIQADAFLWSTGEKAMTMTANEDGNYFVELRTGQCLEKDSVFLEYYPVDISLGNDTAFCNEILLQLDAGEGSDYFWWPAFSDSRYLMVRDSGTYGVSKRNIYGCANSDTFRLIENCGPYFLLPTAFTPNGDDLNDRLKGVHLDVTEFEVHLYNRWGEEVFYANDPNSAWDGTVKGEPVPAGIYIYRITYGGADHLGKYHRKQLKGTVLLYR